MRHLLQLLVVVAVFHSWACINVPEVVQVPETPDAGESESDSGTPDASVPDSGIPDSGTLDLTVQLQSSRSITNGDVQLTVTLSGPAPEEVELLVDGEVVARLSPPYELRWDTQSLAEGEHVLSARATLGARRYTSGSRLLVVDRTRPRLVSQTPLPGERTVSVHQVVQATFSEALDATSVSTESVKLLSGGGVVASDVSLSSEGTSLTLRPVSPLPIDTLLTVSFESSVADLAGNAVQPPEQEWAWMAPGYLQMGTPLSGAPEGDTSLPKFALRIHEPGHPIVAWVGTRPGGGTYGVNVNRWSGDDWAQLGDALDGNPGGTFPDDCSLQMDAGGQMFVAWREGIEPSGANVHVRRWNGGEWDALGQAVLPLLPQAWISHFQFRVNKAGDKVLALLELSGSNSQVSVWSWNGNAWNVLGSALKVNATSSVSSMQVQLDGAGKAVVAWSESTGGVTTPHMRRWTGSAWEEVTLPFQGFPGVFLLDGSDRPVLARSSWDGTALHALLWRQSGNSWNEVGGPVGGLFPGATDATVGALGVDSEGRLVAMISEPEVSGGASVLYLRRWTGTSWESVGGLLKLNTGLNQIDPMLAVDPSGQLLLARIEATVAEPSTRRIHVYRPND